MQKDVADSSADKQHAYHLQNMRLRHSDTNTLTALVNEEGTLKARDKDQNIVNIKGTVIGFNTINETAVLFTHEEEGVDYITNINPDELIKVDETSEDHMPKFAKPNTLHPVLCSLDCLINGVTQSYFAGNISLSTTTANTELLITIAITKFFGVAYDPNNYNGDDESIDITLGSGTDNFSIRKPNSAQDLYNLKISRKDAYAVSSRQPYVFYIRFHRPDGVDRTNPIDYSCSVALSSTDIVQTSDNVPSSLIGANINVNIHVPSIEDDGGETPTPDPTPDPDDNTVICDYDEDKQDKVCDHIYLITAEKSNRVVEGNNDIIANVFEYFRGNLGFSTEYPIESTVYFENEKIKKIYWVDGIHPMRYANIADKNGDKPWTSNLLFDSVPILHLQERVTIERNSTGGMFPSGTVQWAFTYMKRYGAESNIAWISPIHYSSPDDRGGAPGENCANSFTLTIKKYEPDGRFDYIRLYHIVHTSFDAEVAVRRVADIPVPTANADGTYPPIVFTDTNTTGEVVDPNELLYLGGISVYPNTLEQKSNTLFLGNLKQQFHNLRDVLENTIPFGQQDESVQFVLHKSDISSDKFSGYYSHENQLKSDSYNITSFQRGEEYRFGFQAQDKTGKWSDVWWLGDYTNSDVFPTFQSGMLNTVHATFSLNTNVVTKLRKEGYRKVRPVVVYPKPWERNIYTSGLLNPTVYNVKDRASNAPFAQSSWFLRPFSPIDLTSLTLDGLSASNKDAYGNYIWDTTNGYTIPSPEFDNGTGNFYGGMDSGKMLASIAIDPRLFVSYDASTHQSRFDFDEFTRFGSWAEFRHNHPLGDSQQRNGELPTMYNRRPNFRSVQRQGTQNQKYSLTFPYTGSSDELRKKFTSTVPDFFYVDQSIFTMNSADIDFDDALQATKLDDCKMRIVGLVPINSFISSYDIMTSTPPNKFYTEENNGMVIAPGLYASEIVGSKMTDVGQGWKSLINAPLWFDDISWNSVEDVKSYKNDAATPVGFAVYPWQCQGSLNNDSIGSRKTYPTDTKEDKKESKNNTGDNYISAELKSKVLANLHYSWRTCYIKNLSVANDISVKAKTVLDEQQVSLTNITEPDNSELGSLHYFGSVDKLITPISGFVTDVNGDSETAVTDAFKYPLTRYGGYPKMVTFIPYAQHSIQHGEDDYPNKYAFSTPYIPLSAASTINGSAMSSYIAGTGISLMVELPDLKKGADRTMSSVPIKYKSGNHIVVALDYIKEGNDKVQSCLDRYVQYNHSSVNTGYPFWDKSADKFKAVDLFNSNDVFDAGEVTLSTYSYGSCSFNYTKFFSGQITLDNYVDNLCGYLYLGQLYRDTVVNRFGGTTEEAIEQNLWLPAGEAVYLKSDNAATLEWSAGDTYYQRYDALRTYPFTEEDQNKVIDIVSFMTETHINIDGRYDKNRGLSDNNHVRPTNFNQLNRVYSQQDNFFTYHTINRKKVQLDVFEYSFTWTLNKVAGALRDEWTRLTLASTYNCDGNKGSLNRIVRLDTQLVAFQDSGIAQILFNETSQMQAADGLPFELANSGRMQGLRYYTTEVGCQNKWSIAVQPTGIYWVDARTNSMNVLADGIQPVSTTKGMYTWFINRSDLGIIWHPGEWQGLFMHSDKTTGELFLTGNDTCLCFDTMTGEFTSFYDYQNTTAMFAINDTVFTVAPDRSTPESIINLYNGKLYTDHIWLHRKNINKHCFIYNKQYSASVEIICNSNNQGNDYGTDKIFDNLEWRADAWERNDGWDYKPFVTFDNLSGNDHYQRFEMELNAVNGDAPDNNTPQLDNPAKPVNLRKKFKVWHTTMPRAKEQDAEGNWVQTRDRVRDTWCHIKLELTPELSKYRHILHDIIVTYFI